MVHVVRRLPPGNGDAAEGVADQEAQARVGRARGKHGIVPGVVPDKGDLL